MSNKTFQKRDFNPQTEHNARFVKRKLNLNNNTFDAMLAYIEKGGVITVCKPGKRTRANTSFKKG